MIHRSPVPDVAVPNQTLTEYVLSGAEARADKNAIVDGPSGRALTYGDLAARVRRAARGLSLRAFGIF